jgi:malic enzyme
MKCAAAKTIASLARKNEVVPDFMDPDVHQKVAKAVALVQS